MIRRALVVAAVTGGALGPQLAGPVPAAMARTTSPPANPAPGTQTTPPPANPAPGTQTTPPPANPAPGTPTTPPPPNPSLVIVRVTNTPVSRPIPPGFVGFSFEFRAVRKYTGSNPHAINPVLVQLIRDVAPEQSPVIRIGGNSTDDTWWPTPGLARSPGITDTITPSWLATTRALAIETGGKLILGLNLKLDSTAAAAAEARAYRLGIGTRLIDAFEIGNEPELYPITPFYYTWPGPVAVYPRPRSYNFAAYAREISQIASRLPNVPLAGPATGTLSWLARLQLLFAAEPRLKIVTYHRYPLIRCFTNPGDAQYPSIPNLLSAPAARDLLAGTAKYIALAHAHGATFRVDELNSVACKGQLGVSDTFASALWVLDTLFATAQAGVDGVNIHTLPEAVYKPFTFTSIHGHWLANVRPEYYGLLMFSQAAPPRSHLIRVSQTTSADIRSRAVLMPTGEIHVVLINDGLTSGHVVAVRPPARVRLAVLERLSAPSAAATSGVTLGGQTFGAETGTGTLTGHLRTIRVTPHQGKYLITMPPASAAMLALVPAAS